MIGDTIAIKEAASAPWASIPGGTAGVVTCVKVNQDNYTAEYRYTHVTDGRYIIRVRNSIEPATASKVSYDRHNLEISYFGPIVDGVEPPPVIVYWILRFPNGTTLAIKEALFYALGFSFSEATMDKIFNFES